MNQSVLLLSGGLDSTVNMAIAVAEGAVRLAITCDYGQRAAVREIASARAISRRYAVRHLIIPITWLGEIAATPLTRADATVPSPADEGFDVADAKVWIPNRNGVLLNVAAACAEAIGADSVITGFNAEEAVNFPDNSAGFIAAANEAFRFSCKRPVRTMSHTIDLDKKQIFQLARRYDAPVELSWWCYDGGDAPCWRCASCARFRMAAEACGCVDWLAAKGVVFRA